MNLPQIFTHSMPKSMATARKRLAKLFKGVDFRIIEDEENGRIVGETTVTNLDDLKDFNKKALKEGGLPRLGGKERN